MFAPFFGGANELRTSFFWPKNRKPETKTLKDEGCCFPPVVDL